MSEPRKRHYVPQFYQRGFVSDLSNRIWVYAKGWRLAAVELSGLG